MDENKKAAGQDKIRVYSNDSRRYAQELELKRRRRIETRQAEQRNEQPSQPVKDRRPLRSTEEGPVRVRRREQENWQKMRILFAALGVLVVLLIGAIVYEVILGHGTRETGADRMAGQNQVTVSDQESGQNQNASPEQEADQSQSASPEQGSDQSQSASPEQGADQNQNAYSEQGADQGQSASPEQGADQGQNASPDQGV